MNNRLPIGSLMLLLLACLPAFAAAEARLKAVSWGEGPRPRLLLDFTAKPGYRLSRSEHPARLSIELDSASSGARLIQPPATHPVAARMGAAPGKGGHGLRIWVDLKHPSEARTHLENLGAGMRLVVDWTGVARGERRSTPPEADSRRQGEVAGIRRGPRFVVAIDAGHGGKDTGAIGPSGVQEKDVVLAIARKLAGFIRAEPGMRAVMVRDGDQYVGLRRRIEIARRAGADLLVSLHADAHASPAATGSSVFTPYRRAPLEASDLAAAKVLRELRKNFQVHHKRVQKAGFMVLKCVDVPSLLVETAFISNPEEERNLQKARHQQRLARSVFYGIRAYAAANPSSALSRLRLAEAEKN